MTAKRSPLPGRLRVVDSHTIGEPTRVVVDPSMAALLDLGGGTVRARRDAFRARHDEIRRALVGDPRGVDAMVGVILVPPSDPSCRFGAFYVNRVGYLDMCGHATIGLAVTLGATGAIEPGTFRLETPAGVVVVRWHGGGEVIDHVVLLGPPADPGNHGKAFVLCPDGAFDRSPCGTGTGALVGCLHEDGLLAAGETWRQESVLGGVYEASVRRAEGVLVPTVKGRAWITAESELRFEPDDPYRTGLAR